MTKQPHELFSPDRPVRSDFSREGGIPYAVRRVITLIVLAALLIGGGYWVWESLFPSVPGEVPTVKAEGPYKQRPEEPGGIDIPHQDVQVYHEIDGKTDADTKQVVEHMLPPPETPNAQAIMPAPTGIDTEPAAKPESLIPTTVDGGVKNVAPAAPQSQNPPALVPEAVVAPVPAAVVPSATTPQAKEVVRPVAVKPATAAVVSGKAAVQLAAFPDQQEAKQKVQELQTKYQTILGSAKLRLVRVDLGKKGIFYRVQSQPVSESQAKSICSSMKDIHAGCLIVRN